MEVEHRKEHVPPVMKILVVDQLPNNMTLKEESLADEGPEEDRPPEDLIGARVDEDKESGPVVERLASIDRRYKKLMETAKVRKQRLLDALSLYKLFAKADGVEQRIPMKEKMLATMAPGKDLVDCKVMKHRFDGFDCEMNANASQAAVVNQLARQPLHADHPNSKSSREWMEKTQSAHKMSKTQSVEPWDWTELVETEIWQNKQDEQVTQTNYILTNGLPRKRSAVNSSPGEKWFISQWKLGIGLAVQDWLREIRQIDPNHETWITDGETPKHQSNRGLIRKRGSVQDWSRTVHQTCDRLDEIWNTFAARMFNYDHPPMDSGPGGNRQK